LRGCILNKVLILGSSGFLGKEIVSLYLDEDCHIEGVDKAPTKIKNNKFVSHEMEIKTFIKSKKYDLSEYNTIIDAATVLPFKNNKKKLMDENIYSAQELVKCSFDQNISIVYISSSGIYGMPSSNPIKIETENSPLDFYGDSKLQAEKILSDKLQQYNFSVIRPKAILGTARGGIFEVFFNLIEKNIPIPLPNYGEQVMQFVDVKDVARLSKFLSEKKINGVWPAAGPEPLTLNQYLDILEGKIQKKIYRLKLNATIFKFIGNILVTLKLTNFTKWHFGGYSHSSYFDKNWLPEGFTYKNTSIETFLTTAKYHLKFSNDE
jgi:nucleoside-diphosphate-sugar epimerase|tara:strand:- start:12303 stop:13265 length:963 start_codon:yes stop_codon:yes gene_type:complete